MTSITEPFTVGQTVRWGPDLAAGWYEGRAADGASYSPGAQVGRVTSMHEDDGYCGTCDHLGRDCPDPWCVVDFGDGPADGLGGMYGQHELEAA